MSDLPDNRSMKMQFSVPADKVDEMTNAWREVLSGKRSVVRQLAEYRDEASIRGVVALQVLVKTIQRNPGTGQVRRLVLFLAGLYNGPQFPFDMTELRGLDRDLRDACLDVLELDTYGQKEIHHWGVIDGASLEALFESYRLYDQIPQRG